MLFSPRFKSEFGEQLVGKSDPVIVLLNLETRETETFAPTESEGWMPGQILFHGENSIIGTAVSVNPRPLGVIYCTNRPKVVFKLCLKTKEYKVIFFHLLHALYS